MITGVGRVEGRPVAVIAHDFTVKAGSWGELTCEKQIRILERADRDLLPVVYLVDSAGGRLTDQIGLLPRPPRRVRDLPPAGAPLRPGAADLLPARPVGGRRRLHAGVQRLGRAWSRATRRCTWRRPGWRRRSPASVTTLEEMGGATMHATVSGCGDEVFDDDWEAIAAARLLLSYLPDVFAAAPGADAASRPSADWLGRR